MERPTKGIRPWEFWFLLVLGVLALALVVANISLYMGNRALQVQVNDRQNYLNQTLRLSNLNNQLIRALAALSATTGDARLREMLEAHGISFTVNVPDNGPVAPAPGASGGERP
ncbi:MAG: hypothetical protein M3Z21_17405 [Pseudomonadota bacterium]|nr:hypothetical protein [Pseudomonadota bacterium]